MNNKCPPHRLINRAAQSAALKAFGYEITPEVVAQYVFIVRRMSREERSEIFFLAANDKLFKPKVCKLGSSIVTDL